MKIIIIVIAVLVCLMLGPRLVMMLNAWRMKGKDAPDSHKASRVRVKAGEKTLLYFYTSACPACKMQEPIIQRAKEQYPGAVYKVDAMENRGTAKDYGVMGVPFCVFIENGSVMKAAVGVQSEAAIVKFFRN